MALAELLRKPAAEPDVDVLREGVRVLAEVLMDLEVTQHLGAERHERTPERTKARQVAETVNSQLAEQARIEVNQAQHFWGLCARLSTKLTAHTCCPHLNHLLGAPEPLRIKALAFLRPN